MKKLIILIVCFTIFSVYLGVLALETSCIMPTPDGSGSTPSPPSITGEIKKVEHGFIEVEANKPTKGGTRTNLVQRVRIKLDVKTKIFTSYGGYVSPKELVGGEYADIWYVGCHASKAGKSPLASVIKIDVTR